MEYVGRSYLSDRHLPYSMCILESEVYLKMRAIFGTHPGVPPSTLLPANSFI